MRALTPCKLHKLSRVEGNIRSCWKAGTSDTLTVRTEHGGGEGIEAFRCERKRQLHYQVANVCNLDWTDLIQGMPTLARKALH